MRLFENVVNVHVDVDYNQRQISFYSNPVITLDWAAALFPPGGDPRRWECLCNQFERYS
jgi:hypothetical protein